MPRLGRDSTDNELAGAGTWFTPGSSCMMWKCEKDRGSQSWEFCMKQDCQAVKMRLKTGRDTFDDLSNQDIDVNRLKTGIKVESVTLKKLQESLSHPVIVQSQTP